MSLLSNPWMMGFDADDGSSAVRSPAKITLQQQNGCVGAALRWDPSDSVSHELASFLNPPTPLFPAFNNFN